MVRHSGWIDQTRSSWTLRPVLTVNAAKVYSEDFRSSIMALTSRNNLLSFSFFFLFPIFKPQLSREGFAAKSNQRRLDSQEVRLGIRRLFFDSDQLYPIPGSVQLCTYRGRRRRKTEFKRKNPRAVARSKKQTLCYMGPFTLSEGGLKRKKNAGGAMHGDKRHKCSSNYV